jgi:hypothetical protein
MNKMSITLDDGTIKEYEVILIYKSNIRNKEYIVWLNNI